MDHASARATVVDGVAIASAPASAIVAPRVAGLHHWEPGGWRLADHPANPITAFRSGTTGERRRDGLDTDRGSYECFGPRREELSGRCYERQEFSEADMLDTNCRPGCRLDSGHWRRPSFFGSQRTAYCQ